MDIKLFFPKMVILEWYLIALMYVQVVRVSDKFGFDVLFVAIKLGVKCHN